MFYSGFFLLIHYLKQITIHNQMFVYILTKLFTLVFISEQNKNILTNVKIRKEV